MNTKCPICRVQARCHPSPPCRQCNDPPPCNTFLAVRSHAPPPEHVSRVCRMLRLRAKFNTHAVAVHSAHAARLNTPAHCTTHTNECHPLALHFPPKVLYEYSGRLTMIACAFLIPSARPYIMLSWVTPHCFVWPGVAAAAAYRGGVKAPPAAVCNLIIIER